MTSIGNNWSVKGSEVNLCVFITVLPSANVIQERGYKKLLKLKKYNLPKLDFKSGDYYIFIARNKKR